MRDEREVGGWWRIGERGDGKGARNGARGTGRSSGK